MLFPSELIIAAPNSVTANKTKPVLMADYQFDDGCAKAEKAAAGTYQSSAKVSSTFHAGRNLVEQEWAAREVMVFSYSHESSKGSIGYWTSAVPWSFSSTIKGS